MKAKTYIAIVLDKSGSMKKVKEETVKGYNQQIKTLMDEYSENTYLSFVTFNEQVHEEFFNVSIDNLKEMREDEYQPDGWTAMWDAIGYTVEKLCDTTDTLDDFNSYLIIIISDGKENRSKNWIPGKKDLPKKIKELQETNRWTFTYIGANQRLDEVRQTLNFNSSNMLEYKSSKEGTTNAFARNSKGLSKFLKAKSASAANFSMNDYFLEGD